MGLDPAVLWWAVLSLAAMSAAWRRQRDDTLPDVIIGKPQLADDVLGDPISQKEIEDSLKLEITVPEEDPTTRSGYFQGDIVVESRDHLHQILLGDPEGQHSAVSNTSLLWPQGVIPYVISDSFSSCERKIIARAMEELSSVSCLSFVPKALDDYDYVHIIRREGCFSSVGRQGRGQGLTLGSKCLHVGVVLHEFMHAAGFWHEQSRSDRDEYVIINLDNIIEGKEPNFEKQSNRDLGLPYDYDSITHYGRYAFSNEEGPTIVPKQRGVTIGQREGLSAYDVEGLNLLYNCPYPWHPPSYTDDSPRCSVSDCKKHCSPKHNYIRAYCRKSCGDCGSPLFICKDNDHKCPERAAKGQCTSSYPKVVTYMMTYCRESCDACGSPLFSCKDNDHGCPGRAAKGHCTSRYVTNVAYMMAHCRKSCDVCDSQPFFCTDDDHNCPDWAADGYCTSNNVEHVAYMMAYCRKSCGVCESPPSPSPCKDKNQHCYVWARNDRCSSKHDEIFAYMKAYCRASCGFCEPPGRPEQCMRILGLPTRWCMRNAVKFNVF